SKFKISIIQAVDRQVRLDDIASEKNLDYSELLSELESIVMSGTKINLDYFIREILDEDEIEDIFSYFRETEHDDLEEALKELGDDYDEDDIRLVRIKFLSEMGN
ncbi:MAG: helix-turn-helix domain-containing protein, partial [Bacteroidaceae bacterium]|nr:helix-turn-helix domain-containing protein [Bacteroidaceae bacterium]